MPGGGNVIAGGGSGDYPNQIGGAGLFAVIGGGAENFANNNSAAIGGGQYNIADGLLATVPGGFENTAHGAYSFAAGQQAKANGDGTFVFADSTFGAFSTTSSNQFLVRASGGVGINTNAPQTALHVRGAITATAITNGPAIAGTAVSGSNLGVQGVVGTNASPYVNPTYLDSGVYGESTDFGGNGVVGVANNGEGAYAVWGVSENGLAGRFDGRVEVNGLLYATGVNAGAFSGDGTWLTNVNASQLGGFGLPSFVVNGRPINGDGSGLTNVNAAHLGGLAPSAFVQTSGGAMTGGLSVSSPGQTAIYGEALGAGANGVVGVSATNGYAITGIALSGYAGYFIGNMQVNGVTALNGNTTVAGNTTLRGGNADNSQALTVTTPSVAGVAVSALASGGGNVEAVRGVVGSAASSLQPEAGVYGEATSANGAGVVGEANNGSLAYGVYGRSTSGYAGYFDGMAQVNGALTVSGPLNANGGINLPAGALVGIASANLSSNLSVGGSAVVDGAFNGASASLSGNLGVAGATTVNGLLTANQGIAFISNYNPSLNTIGIDQYDDTVFSAEEGIQMESSGHSFIVDIDPGFPGVFDAELNLDGFVVRMGPANSSYMYFNADGDFSVTANIYEGGKLVLHSLARPSPGGDAGTGTLPVREILEKVATLPIDRWTSPRSPDVGHISPSAEDFHTALKVGPDAQHISALDVGGVALAALQGLNQKLEQALAARDTEIRALKQRLDRLDQALTERNRAPTAVEPVSAALPPVPGVDSEGP